MLISQRMLIRNRARPGGVQEENIFFGLYAPLGGHPSHANFSTHANSDPATPGTHRMLRERMTIFKKNFFFANLKKYDMPAIMPQMVASIGSKKKSMPQGLKFMPRLVVLPTEA